MNRLSRISTASSLEAIRQLRTELSEALARSTLGADRRGDILLAVSEIASNIERHAKPPATFVAVELGESADGYEIRIDDDGGPFNEYAEKQAQKRGIDVADVVGESGMGISLVMNLFSTQHYVKADPMLGRPHNCLSLYIESEQAAAARPRIAVVDDDESLRNLLRVYLSDEFDVTDFASGVDALKSLCVTPVDLVISDIRMPGMDGFELRKRLGRYPEADLIPFIFLTGDGEDATRAEAAGLSVDDFLLKNVRKQELCTAVKRVLNRATHLRQRLGDRLDQAITPPCDRRILLLWVGLGLRSGPAQPRRVGGTLSHCARTVGNTL